MSCSQMETAYLEGKEMAGGYREQLQIMGYTGGIILVKDFVRSSRTVAGCVPVEQSETKPGEHVLRLPD